MKPFDLERALAGDKVVTRDGRGVTDFAYFPTMNKNYACTIRAVVDGNILSFLKDGKYLPHIDSSVDLHMADKVYYLNIYMNDEKEIEIGKIKYSDYDQASRVGRTISGYVKTLEIEI